MRTRFLWIVAVCATASSADAQETINSIDYSGDYLCEMKAAGGLKFDESSKTWNGVRFSDVNQTIAVHVESIFDGVPKAFYKIAIGDKADKELSYCTDRMTSQVNVVSFNGQMSCHDAAYDYTMNWNTMRFQYYSAGSYTAGEQTGTANPSVVIGICQKTK